MKAFLKSIGSIICLLSLQLTVAYAEGGGSGTGSGDYIPLDQQTQASDENKFDKILSLYKDSKKSLTSFFSSKNKGLQLVKHYSDIYLYSSDGTRLGNRQEYVQFQYYVTSRGLESDKLQVELTGFFPFIDVNGKDSFNYSIEINDSPTENIGILVDGTKVKFKVTQYNGKDFILGIITTNEKGECYEMGTHGGDSTSIKLELKNNICATFAIELKQSK